MRHRLGLTILLAALWLAPVAARAQSDLEGRVGRLEDEMHAVQRKVFPGGSGQYITPDIAPPGPSGDLPGTPASSPVADLDARVSAIESQMSALTGQVETTQHRVQVLEDDFAAYKRATDDRLRALEGSGTAVSAASNANMPATRPPPSRPGGKDTDTASPAASPDHGAQAAGIEKPSTGDPVEDDYLYGYRLWQAKKYPEAEAQLKSFVAAHPDSKRASYAQNLLGRSYLDEGKPSLASIAFYDNYKKMPDGDRAPDSLYYLAQALMQLKKPADACKVYGELSDVYGAKISADMKARVTSGRADAKCK